MKKPNRTQRINFRVTPEELESLNRTAQLHNQRIGQYCRDKALEKPSSLLLELKSDLSDLCSYVENLSDDLRSQVLHEGLLKIEDLLLKHGK